MAPGRTSYHTRHECVNNATVDARCAREWYLPSMAVAYVKDDERHSDQDAAARNRAHAHEQRQGHGAQIAANDRSVLRDLRTGTE